MGRYFRNTLRHLISSSSRPLGWYLAARELLRELSNSFRRTGESQAQDRLFLGVPLGAPRLTEISGRVLSETEWRERTSGIIKLHTARPWASLFDLSLYLEGWNHAAAFYGRTCIAVPRQSLMCPLKATQEPATPDPSSPALC